jgi:hypothetical protein
MFPVSLTKWHYTEVADPRQLHCVKVVKVLGLRSTLGSGFGVGFPASAFARLLVFVVAE